jgi:hypothetical protein
VLISEIGSLRQSSHETATLSDMMSLDIDGLNFVVYVSSVFNLMGADHEEPPSYE